jgi:hypothetical protein
MSDMNEKRANSPPTPPSLPHPTLTSPAPESTRNIARHRINPVNLRVRTTPRLFIVNPNTLRAATASIARVENAVVTIASRDADRPGSLAQIMAVAMDWDGLEGVATASAAFVGVGFGVHKGCGAEEEEAGEESADLHV